MAKMLTLNLSPKARRQKLLVFAFCSISKRKWNPSIDWQWVIRKQQMAQRNECFCGILRSVFWSACRTSIVLRHRVLWGTQFWKWDFDFVGLYWITSDVTLDTNLPVNHLGRLTQEVSTDTTAAHASRLYVSVLFAGRCYHVCACGNKISFRFTLGSSGLPFRSPRTIHFSNHKFPIEHKILSAVTY